MFAGCPSEILLKISALRGFYEFFRLTRGSMFSMKLVLDCWRISSKLIVVVKETPVQR